MCRRKPIIHNRALFELVERPAEREALRRLEGWRRSARGVTERRMDAAATSMRRNPGTPGWQRWAHCWGPSVFWTVVAVAGYGLAMLVW